MKSVKSDRSCEPTITYPCLMEGISSGVVILFSSAGAGMIVHKANHGNHVGDYSCSWGMASFLPYNGSVCLEN